MKKWTILYFIILAVVFGVGIYRHADNWEKTAVIVPGTVVDAKVHRSSDGETTYAEVVSFEFNGEKHQLTRGFSSSGRPKIGRTREVIVNPSNPEHSRVKLAAIWEFLFPSTIKNHPNMGFMWMMGAVFFGVGWFFLTNNYEFFRRAIIVKGTVTSFSTRRGSKGGTSYVEEITFEFDGQQHTVSGMIGRSWKPKIGTVREVGVDPRDINKFRVRGGKWFFGIFLAIGVLLLLVSAFA